MPESETSSLSEASESTIEAVSFDMVLEILKSATKDVKESKDYLSYITVLDMYLNTPGRYSYVEREEILAYLLEILNENTDLCYEIAWDLPALILLYVESDYDFSLSIRAAPCVYKIIKIFECLAINGNPKELFLRCCEIMSSMRLQDITSTDNEEFKEKFFEIKLYCIFELIDSSLKKIETIYPSRFLTMFVTSFINLIHLNCLSSLENGTFILKRVFSFARNYNSLPTPKDDQGYTKDELAKVKDDEDYLQRKLLTSLITQSVAMIGKYEIFGYSMDEISYFHELRNDDTNKYREFTIDFPVFDRLVELSSSFDIDLGDSFKNFLVTSHELFDKFDCSKDIDSLTGEIFESLIIDYQKNLEYTLVNSDAKEVRDSKIGHLLLYTYEQASQRNFEAIQLSMSDVIVLTLRLIVPGMVQPSFLYKSIHDMVVYWAWYSIHQLRLNNKSIQLELTKIPKAFLTLYYQVLLYIFGVNSSYQNFANCSLTLMTKILTLSPESFAYDFILDSLKECPYDNVRPVLIQILKDLLTKEKSINLEEGLQNISLSEDNTKKENTSNSTAKKTSPPPLPSREPVNGSSKYIQLTKVRTSSIIELILSTINKTFISNEENYAIDQGQISTLSAFLNLVIIIKKDPNVQKDQIESIITAMESRIAAFKTSRKDNKEPTLEDNQVDILTLVVDRIKP